MPGKAEVLRSGGQVALWALGAMVEVALAAAQLLEAQGTPVTVVDARWVKPLDEELINQLARNHEVLLTIEEGAVGGFGAFTLQLMASRGLLDSHLKVRTLTLPDVFQDQDKPEVMYANAGLTAQHIAKQSIIALGRGDTNMAGAVAS